MTNISRRSVILDTIKTLFEAVTPGMPVSDPYPFKFGRVFNGPLTMNDFAKQFSVGIVVGDEKKSDSLYPVQDCTLSIAIEFQRVRQKNEGTSSSVAEETLTVVQRVINDAAAANPKMGLAFVHNIRETNNTIDLDSFADKAVAGVLFIEVQYRHTRYDTRN